MEGRDDMLQQELNDYTHSIITDYCNITGNSVYHISAQDYIAFRQQSVNEMHNGITVGRLNSSVPKTNVENQLKDTHGMDKEISEKACIPGNSDEVLSNPVHREKESKTKHRPTNTPARKTSYSQQDIIDILNSIPD